MTRIVKYVPVPNLKNVRDGKPVARRILAFLIAHPELHEQESWTGARQYDDTGTEATLREHGKQRELHCGTTCCIGGAIALGDGWTWAEIAQGRPTGETNRYGEEVIESVEDFAGKRLGLDYDAAYSVFHEMDEKSALKRLAQVADGTYDHEEFDANLY